MPGSLLLELIGEAQCQVLSPDVRNALEDHLNLKNDSVSSLKGEIQRIKADYEQKCYELDKKFIESASRLDSESTQNEKATAKCKELEKELENLRSLHKNMEKTMHNLETENLSLRRVKDSWDEDKLGLQHVIQKRDLEVSRLNDEWKDLSVRLLEATNSRNELQIKLDEISSSEVTSHYHTKRVEQEKELLTEQNTQLANDLNQKSAQYLALQKEKQEEIILLQSQLDLTLSESKQLKELVETMKKNETNMQEKMNDLNEKFNKASEEYQSTEDMHRNELQSQSRLAQLYKDSAEDAEKKCEELVSAVEELQAVIKANAEESENNKKQIEDAKNEVYEMYKESERLKKELEGANDLIMANKRRELSDEELVELCPTAALTSKFIKSGMTLTQIYARYVEQTDELIVAKEENKRLNEAMDSILNELNEKAPLLKRQREDYERALVTINQLTSQTDEAAIEFQQLRQEADDAVRRNELSKRDNERLRKEATDLSKQVCFLLREVEELRGRQILMSPKSKGEKSLLVVNDDGSCNDVSSSSELITQTLVTFKDIAELQEQNQKLLATIRKLSEDQEEAEKLNMDEKTKSFQHELELAQDELERLREDRNRQMTLVETIVRQRDMYRVLLAQNPEGGVPPSVLASPSLLANTSWTASGSAPVTPTSRGHSKSPRTPEFGLGESARKALSQLQDEYTEYKQEVLDNNKVYEKKITELQDELLHQKGNCAKLDSQLEFSKERYNIMMNNTDCNKKEADALRNRNHQLYSVIQQHERNVGNLSAELADMRESNSSLQARYETLQRELEICKRAEDRLNTENSSLKREHNSQMVLLGNLQKMQQSMEAQAFEVKTQLNTRVEAQEREIKSLRQKNHSVAQNKQDEIQKTEKQLYVVQKQYDAEQLKTVKLSHELATLKNASDNMERELNDSKAKLSSVEERLARISSGSLSVEGEASSGNSQDTIRLLRQEVKDKSHEVLSLEMRMEKLKQHADHFRDVSVAAEESLKQTNEANKELLDSLQQRLEHSNQQVIDLEQQLYKIEEENNLLKNEKYKVTGEVEKQTAELRRQLTGVQGELEASLRRRDEAVKNEQIAIDDLKQQVAKAEEASDNYQREMMLHASAVQQLLELKEKVKNFDNELEKERSRALSLEEELKEKTTSCSDMENRIKSETQQAKEKYEELVEQNKILHNQIQSLSGRMVELQSQQSPMSTPTKSLYASRDPVAVATAAVESGDSQSNSQLLDVIKFLRREKEISDTKSELVQSELTRIKQQMLQYQKQISEMQEKFEAEQKRAMSAEEQLSGLSSLKRQVSIMKETEEQNKVLRAEREQMDEDLRSANNRITKMQEDVAPLQQKNRELSSQIAVLQADKKASLEEAERWKERVQQMTQSPRRQDPEEYRRLIQEKTLLASKVDTLSKEVADLKAESSNQKGQMRTLETTLQASKTEISKLEEQNKARTNELTKAREEIDEKIQTANKIRRVGRRFKQQYEELLAKQQKIEEEKKKEEEKPAEQAPPSSVDAGKAEELESALKQANASLSEERARLQALSQELSRSQEENKTLKSQHDEVVKKLDDFGQSQSELQGENVALRSQSEERSKNVKELTKQIEDLKKEKTEITEKEKKFTKLLQLARKQLEKLRKENQEFVENREKVAKEMNKLESEKKTESDQKAELQAKVEELQLQLNELRSTSSIQGSERKAATIRPTSAQQVNQVKPMRVTRTARVMPEPQQESQDADRPGSSSAAPQAASSSTQPVAAASVPAVVSVSSHATAFVYPMSPARQQQPVGSSVTSGQGAQQEEARSGTSGEASTEGGEGDNAIVSSSDDQQVQEEPPASVPGPSTASTGATNIAEGEASSSSSTPRFVAPSSSAVLNVSSATNQPRPYSLGQKRSHEEGDESARPGSSREAQVAVAPIAKRQRADQSSESVSVLTPSSGTQTDPPRPIELIRSPSRKLTRRSPGTPSGRSRRIVLLRSKPIFKKEEKVEVNKSVTSVARQPDQSQQSDLVIIDDNLAESEIHPESAVPEVSEPIVLEPIQESNVVVTEEVSQSVQVDYSENQSQPAMQQDVASSSVEQSERVIVLSSDDEADLDHDEVDDMNDVENSEEEEQDPGVEDMVEDIESQTPSTTRPEIPIQAQQPVHPSGNLPNLTLSQDTIRARLPSRPPPLTPGMIFPTSTDDDSIVPCTPTLMTHRVDESYHAISSPRVPPVRFQFEDVTQTQTSLAAVPGGLASVDNTIMDLTGAGGDESSRSVPSISSSSTAASFSSAKISTGSRDTQSPGNLGSAAVSSSIQEEVEECEEGDQAIPSNVTDTGNEARSSIPSQSVIGRRRLRVIGAPRPSRGRGNNSPSTSNQP